MSEVAIEPLFAEHRNERGEQGDQQACIEKVGNVDYFVWGTFPGGRRDGLFARDGGLVESEEDGAKVRNRLVAGIGLEFGLDVDNEGGADCREQTGLE